MRHAANEAARVHSSGSGNPARRTPEVETERAKDQPHEAVHLKAVAPSLLGDELGKDRVGVERDCMVSRVMERGIREGDMKRGLESEGFQGFKCGWRRVGC